MHHLHNTHLGALHVPACVHSHKRNWVMSQCRHSSGREIGAVVGPAMDRRWCVRIVGLGVMPQSSPRQQRLQHAGEGGRHVSPLALALASARHPLKEHRPNRREDVAWQGAGTHYPRGASKRRGAVTVRRFLESSLLMYTHTGNYWRVGGHLHLGHFMCNLPWNNFWFWCGLGPCNGDIATSNSGTSLGTSRNCGQG